MKPKLILLAKLTLVFCFFLISQILPGQNIENISKLTTTNGKTYLEVDSVPFPIIGAQIRVDFLINCDGKTIQECQPYFEKAKELGVNCVQIPVWWKLIEPTRDNFSWSVLDQILTYLNQYNLKMELLWFSTNMCGESFSNFVPDYILNIPGIKLIRNDGRPYWGYYGYQYNLVLNDSTLISREKNAVTALMEHIREWDIAHGAKHPIISVQVHNEPDIFARWRYDQKQIHYSDNRTFTKLDAWKMTLDALDSVGKAFKNSKYRVVTRTNLVTSSGLNLFPELSTAGPNDVINLDGIDFVGTDPYVTSVDIIKSNTLPFLSLPNNYPLIAENKGSYSNGASLLLAAVSLGSGYNFYDLATSKYVIDHTSDTANIDHGIYTWDLQEKSHTAKIKDMIKGLIKAYPDVATTNNNDFIGFNIQNDFPLEVCSQSINSSKINFNFSTTQGASGFSITKDNYLLIYCTEASQVQMSNAIFSSAIKGHFDNSANFVNEGSANLLEGNILNAEKDVLYKITYSQSTDLTSTSVNCIGAMPTDIINYWTMDFENDTTTYSLIDQLHLDFQTNPAYTRNLFAENPDLSGINKSSRCFSFSGYNSDNEWWYGLDMVLKNDIQLPTGPKYVHALMKSSNSDVDMNKGCLLFNSSWNSLGESWNLINSEWKDYVYPINNDAKSIKEMRFMLNHKINNQITYLDDIIISNSPIPRTIDLPIVSTNQALINSPYSITVGGNVSWNGNSFVKERGICWSTNPNPTTNDSVIVEGSGTGIFNSTLTELRPDTKYYMRSFATNLNGTAYGNQISITTPEYVILDFENEHQTNEIISQLHLDWQTNDAYYRNLYDINPEINSLDSTTRCATFLGYNSDNEWWYGLDIVLKTPQKVSDGQYLHVLMKTNNTNVDSNRGLQLLDSLSNKILESWQAITEKWQDYVFGIPLGTNEFKEMRFMLNHKAIGEVTYIDQIILNNSSVPRTLEKSTQVNSLYYSTITNNVANFNICVLPKDIAISTLQNSFSVNIYNLFGECIYTNYVKGNNIQIPIKLKGVYLVKVNGECKKILIK